MAPTPSLVQSVALLASIPGAMVVHEAAHYVVALLARASPRLDGALTESMAVVYEPPERGWVDTAIRLAPLWSGLLAALAYALLVGWPPVSYWTAIGGLAWFFYAIRESGQDLRDVFGEPAEWEADLLRGTAAMLVAALLMLSPYGREPAVMLAVAVPLFYAGGALVYLGKRGRPGEKRTAPIYEQSQARER